MARHRLFRQIVGITKLSKAGELEKALHIQKAIHVNNVWVFMAGFMTCLGICAIIMLALG